MGGKPVRLVQLGKAYEEEFRQYLHGEAAFPRNAAIWVAVVRSEAPAPLINFPVDEIKGKYHQHHFDVFGLSYFLYVGGSLPEEVTRHCAARSPNGTCSSLTSATSSFAKRRNFSISRFLLQSLWIGLARMGRGLARFCADREWPCARLSATESGSGKLSGPLL